MKKAFFVFVFLALAGITGCEKENDDKSPSEDPSPSWLLPYKGTYSGTYDGDDYGNWVLKITDSPEITLIAHSIPDDEDYQYPGTITKNGEITFFALEIEFQGVIVDYSYVTGTYHNNIYNIDGSFEGWKEPVGANSRIRQVDRDGEIRISYDYDTQGRHIKTQNYSNGEPDDYGIREYYSNEYTYTHYRSDGSVLYEYHNLLPLNIYGCVDYATFKSFGSTFDRFDTCFYEYNQDGYVVKQSRNITLIYHDKHLVEKGTEILVYTIESGNVMLIQDDYSVGGDVHSATYSYTYYPSFVNMWNNLAPYLGTANTNLRKTSEMQYSPGCQTIFYDYSYDFYEAGYVKHEKLIRTEQGNTTEYTNTYYYK